MLPRSKNKQLTNVSVVTLKKLDRKYEIGVFPNKLYEFRHNNKMLLDNIIHSDIIYRNITTGDVCSENDIKVLREYIGQDIDKNEVIRYILMNGYEQKAHETSSYELNVVEKQIVELIQSKVTYNKSYVSKDILLNFIKKVCNIKNIDPKKQVSGIIKKLEEIGFERVSFKVKSDLSINEFYKYLIDQYNYEMDRVKGSVNRIDENIIIKSDLLPMLIEYCENNQIKYVVSKNEEVVDEEIC